MSKNVNPKSKKKQKVLSLNTMSLMNMLNKDQQLELQKEIVKDLDIKEIKSLYAQLGSILLTSPYDEMMARLEATNLARKRHSEPSFNYDLDIPEETEKLGRSGSISVYCDKYFTYCFDLNIDGFCDSDEEYFKWHEPRNYFNIGENVPIGFIKFLLGEKTLSFIREKDYKIFAHQTKYKKGDKDYFGHGRHGALFLTESPTLIDLSFESKMFIIVEQ